MTNESYSLLDKVDNCLFRRQSSGLVQTITVKQYTDETFYLMQSIIIIALMSSKSNFGHEHNLVVLFSLILIITVIIIKPVTTE